MKVKDVHEVIEKIEELITACQKSLEGDELIDALEEISTRATDALNDARSDEEYFVDEENDEENDDTEEEE